MIKFLFRKMINEMVTKEVTAQLDSYSRSQDVKIKDYCHEYLTELFKEKEENTRGNVNLFSRGFDYNTRETLRDRLKLGVAKIVLADIKSQQSFIVDRQIKSEDFIDSIVKRIRDKQI